MQNAGRNDVSEPLCCTANQKGKWKICHWHRQVAMGSRWKIKTSRQRHGDVFLKINFHKRKYSPVVVGFDVSKSSTYSTNIRQSLPRRNREKRNSDISLYRKQKGIPGRTVKKLAPFVVSLLFFGRIL